MKTIARTSSVAPSAAVSFVGLTVSQVREHLQALVVRRLSGSLRWSEDERPDLGVSLAELGVDSLCAIELRNYFLADLGFEIPIEVVATALNVEELVSRLHERAAVHLLRESAVDDLRGLEEVVF